MQSDDTALQSWIADRVERLTHRRLAGPPVIFRDTTPFMAIDRDAVVELDGDFFLVTKTEQERRFGLEGEPKFWVKRAADLSTGRMHILKLVFEESFYVCIRSRQIRCTRSAEKEGRVLELTHGDPRFMQGRVVRDCRGNRVRVIDFIQGTDLLTHIVSLNLSHEEYFHAEVAGLLARTMASFEGIAVLHEAGLCHGDIRNDHVLIEHDTGMFTWIDFDLLENTPEYDVWALGNILHCVLAKGFVTFRELLREHPDVAARLDRSDASEFFPNRVMNLRKVYPYLPDKLNAVLMRFSAGGGPPYEEVRQIVDDVNDCLADFPGSLRGPDAEAGAAAWSHR